MKTTEICEKLNVTRKMLRVYEEQGLLSAARKENNYREYDIEDFMRIQIIVTLRALDFSLKEIKELFETSGSMQELLGLLYFQLDAIELRVKELNKIKKTLTDGINNLLAEKENTHINDEKMLVYLPQKTGGEVYNEIIEKWDFDAMAEDYEKHFLSEDVEYHKAIDYARKLLSGYSKKKTIIDVGAGNCNLWKTFSSDINLTAIDKSMYMILSARKNVPWGTFYLGNILEGAVPEKKYDIVFSSFLIHHIDYKLHTVTFDNLIKLMKDNGTLIVIDRCYENRKEREKMKRYYEKTNDAKGLETVYSECYIIADATVNYLKHYNLQIEVRDISENIKCFVITAK